MSVIAAPPSPYKGLAPFEDSELDALFFFGRERERAILVANLLASRLTVLYGESGVGKSSLLAAAVVRDLRAATPDAVVLLLDTWSQPLDEKVLADVRLVPEAYLVLDQFEEYFMYQGESDEPGTLLHELPELLHDTRVNVLLSLREEALARLDALKARIPTVFGNQVRLEHLDRVEARAATTGPIRRWNELTGETIEIEAELVDTVIDEVAVEGRSRDRTRVEAPYLQLVLERIWERERDAGSYLLRLETLRELGGSGAIVRDHLDLALASLEPSEQDVAAGMFEHLVTPSGTKIAHGAADLAQYAGVPEDKLRPVLMSLAHDRIVHSVDGSDRYEIFHDVLAEPIQAWRQQRRLERERHAARRRQRRLVAVAAAAFGALAIVAGLAVWAFSERGRAQDQARQAHAQALDATALQQLAVDPSNSVRLALAAARLHSGSTGESVLRQALLADRLLLSKYTSEPIRSVATSPRGNLVAAALGHGTLLLLDSRNRRLVRAIDAGGEIAHVSFAGGGRQVVTVSPQGRARLWDASSGAPIPLQAPTAGARTPGDGIALVPLRGRLSAIIDHVRRLAIQPAAALVAAAVSEPHGRIRAWVFDKRGRLLRVLPVRGVTDLQFSPDGRTLAVSTADGFTTLWDTGSGQLVKTLLDAKSGVAALAFSPDGALLATAGKDGAVRIWTVSRHSPDFGTRLFFMLGHTNPVTLVVWSPDGHLVASGSTDRTVVLWRIRGLAGVGSPAATLAGSRGPVRTLAFSADGRRLVSGGDDRVVRVWDARPDQQLEVLGRAPGPALAARWAGRFVVGAWPSVVRVYDAATRRAEHVLRWGRPYDSFTSVAASRDGSIVAAGGDSGGIGVWSGRSGERLMRFGGRSPITAVAVAPDGSLAAAGSRAGGVAVVSVRGRRIVWSGRVTGPVASIDFSPSGDRVLAADPAGAVIWSSSTGLVLHRLSSHSGDTDAVFSPNGRLVATAGGDDAARIWYARTGRLRRRLKGDTKPLTAVAFSRNGALLATSSRDADVHLWGVQRGVGKTLQRSAFGPLGGVSIDSTGRWVAGAGPISVILWTASTGRQLFYVRGHTAPLTGVAFSPSGGATVLSSSRDGTIRLYTCEVCVGLPRLVHLAEVRLAQAR